MIENKAILMEFALKDVQPNPFRKILAYSLDEEKVEELAASIGQTGFWANIVGRLNEAGELEIAYGHHRLQAAIQMLGEDHVQPFSVMEIPDFRMMQMMANENRDTWSNSTKHNNLSVESARDWLDSMLEQYPTWEEAVGAGKFASPNNLEEWFGPAEGDGRNGAGPANYAQCVKKGVGRNVIANFYGWSESKVKYALRQIPLTAKAKAIAAEALQVAEDNQAKLAAKLEVAKKKVATAKNKADKAEEDAKRKFISAELRKADVRKAKVEQELQAKGHYNPDAGKVFTKPLHADAFRNIVTKKAFLDYLPVESQPELARIVLKAAKNDADNKVDGATVKSIEKATWAELRKAKGVLDDGMEDIDPLWQFEDKMKLAKGNIGRARNDIDNLIGDLLKVGIDNVDNFHMKDIAIKMEALNYQIVRFHHEFGIDMPVVEFIGDSKLKLISNGE